MIAIALTTGVIILLCIFFILNIYEVNFNWEKQNLSDGTIKIHVTAIPRNALGFKVPLRKVSTNLKIENEEEQVEIISYNREKGILILKTKDKKKNLRVLIDSEYSLYTSYIDIPINKE